MKRKLFYICYIAIVLFGCFMLFVIMFLEDGIIITETAIQTGKSADEDTAQRIEQYVSTHFGGRKEMIHLYGLLHHKVFDHSPVEDVVAGTDGYLFYGDTIDDYCGTNIMSGRELFNISHTLELMQEAVEQKGAKFAFVVAPNKNSLYDYMPYNYVKHQEKNNLELLTEHLENVNYIDLFPVFQNRDEELYYKTDTHWNDMGACYVFDEMLNVLGKTHDDFQDYEYMEAYTLTGDLQRMLYPLAKDNELQVTFGKPVNYTVLTNTRNFEQVYIETENNNAVGSLLMFRDSFANNLINYFSDAYRYAIYDKAVPYDLTKMEKYDADTVIVEIAERNVELIQEYEPRFLAPERGILSGEQTANLVEEWKIIEDGDMIKITGTVNSSYMQENSRIYIRAANTIREMTPQKIGACEYGFCGYVEQFAAGSVDVIVESETGVWEQAVGIN